ncbi:MAG: hypothetical protein IPO21_13465 [Bacteroidales bacterium]|nr:hypothetical protein [Bacteroidales bacterium]
MRIFIIIFVSQYFINSSLLGQTTEQFVDFNGTSSYSDGFFISSNTVAWHYKEVKKSSSSFAVNAICLNKSDSAYILSDTIQGGCSELQFEFLQEYSTNCSAEVFVNDFFVGELISENEQDTVKLVTFSNLQFCKSFVLKIKQKNSQSGQIAIGSISWKSLNCSVLPPFC